MKSKFIPYGHQSISEEDVKAVGDVLESYWLTQGPFVDKFENDLASYCGAKYGVATCNATAGLHLACLALGIGDGDFVWTSPNTFVASANCALYCGAKIDFVDIDAKTYNINVDALEKKLVIAKKEKKLPKLVIAVHFAGQSCDMISLRCLSKKYGFFIIEDAAHAIGGNFCDKKIGSCFYSDLTVFSFHPVKIITTGEGGMVMTNNIDLYRKLKLLVTHGITKDLDLMDDKSDGAWYYEQQFLGYNFRLTDIQCALGLSQLKRIDEFVKRRHFLAKRYDEALQNLPLIIPFQEKRNFSSYHLYVVRLQLDKLQKTRRQIFDALREDGIGVNVHYIPLYKQPYYRKMGFFVDYCKETENYYREALTLPLYQDLSFADQDYVIECLRAVLES